MARSGSSFEQRTFMKCLYYMHEDHKFFKSMQPYCNRIILVYTLTHIVVFRLVANLPRTRRIRVAEHDIVLFTFCHLAACAHRIYRTLCIIQCSYGLSVPLCFHFNTVMHCDNHKAVARIDSYRIQYDRPLELDVKI
jgi:hypothetical protein